MSEEEEETNDTDGREAVVITLAVPVRSIAPLFGGYSE